MLTIVDAESVVSIEVFDESAVEESVGIDGIVGLVLNRSINPQRLRLLADVVNVTGQGPHRGRLADGGYAAAR